VAITPLTVYVNSFAASTTNASGNPLVVNAGGTSGATITTLIGTATGWGEVWSQGNAAAWPALSAMGAPTGHGWYLDLTTLDGQTLAGGLWQSSIRMKASGAVTVTMSLNFHIYNPSTGGYRFVGSMGIPGFGLTTVATDPLIPATGFSNIAVPVGSKLYAELWYNITVAAGSGAATVSVAEGLQVGAGQANNQVNTPGFDVTPARNVAVRWQPRSMGGTLVSHYGHRVLGGMIIYTIPTPSSHDIPRALGSTIIFGNKPKYIPRALGSTIILPLGGGNIITGWMHSNYLESSASKGWSQEHSLSAAVEQAQARANFLGSIRFGLIKFVPRALGGTLIVPQLAARDKFLQSIRFGRLLYVPRALGGTLIVPQLEAQSKFVESIKLGRVYQVPRALGGTITYPSLAARSTSLEAARFGQVRQIPRALGGTIILPSLESRSTFLGAAKSSGAARSNFLTSIPSKVVSRAKYLLSMRFGRVLYVPRALGGTITYPPTGPVSWTNFLVKVPGANAIVGLARSIYVTSVLQTAPARSRFLSAARFGWLRLVPRVLGGTIIYPSLESRSKFTGAASEKAQAQAKYSISATIKGRAQSAFKSAAVSLAQARAKFLSAARFGWVRLVPRALGGTIIYPSLEAREKSATSIGQKSGGRARYLMAAVSKGWSESSFKIQTLVVIAAIGSITHFVQSWGVSRVVSSMKILRSLPASYVPRALGSTLYMAIAGAINSVKQTVQQALSSSISHQSSLTLNGSVRTSLSVSYQGASMPAPFSSILETITVTDVNGALVSNASVATVIVTWPDDTTVTLTLGAGVTDLGSGQYQAKYNTKMPGIIREVWSIVAADGITLATAQFLVGTEY
jgi:hypothetical protein